MYQITGIVLCAFVFTLADFAGSASPFIEQMSKRVEQVPGDNYRESLDNSEIVNLLKDTKPDEADKVLDSTHGPLEDSAREVHDVETFHWPSFDQFEKSISNIVPVQSAQPAVSVQSAAVLPAQPAAPAQTAAPAQPAVSVQSAAVLPAQPAVSVQSALPDAKALPDPSAAPVQPAISVQSPLADATPLSAQPEAPAQPAVPAETAQPGQAAVVAQVAVPAQISIGAQNAVPAQISDSLLGQSAGPIPFSGSYQTADTAKRILPAANILLDILNRQKGDGLDQIGKTAQSTIKENLEQAAKILEKARDSSPKKDEGEKIDLKAASKLETYMKDPADMFEDLWLSKFDDEIENNESKNMTSSLDKLGPEITKDIKSNTTTVVDKANVTTVNATADSNKDGKLVAVNLTEPLHTESPGVTVTLNPKIKPVTQ